MSNGNKVPEHCRICGEIKKIGYHLGAVICEACKKFYLRCMEKKLENSMICVQSNNACVITKSTRTKCAACRFQKCLKFGVTMQPVKHNPADMSMLSCMVCGKSSSNSVHYGVVTCEACKGFFGRISESSKLECISGTNNCDVSYQKNSCRRCRYQRCIQVGMSLESRKVGRRSNLFNQNLKSAFIGSKIDLLSSNLLDSISDEISQTNTHVDFNFAKESTLSAKTKSIVENVVQNYSILESASFFNYDSNSNEFYRRHMKNCTEFIANIINLDEFSIEDQAKLITCSIHPIRLLVTANSSIKSNQAYNYFNCDQMTFQSICQKLPLFALIDRNLTHLTNSLRELELNQVELALYTAYVALSTSCIGLVQIQKLTDVLYTFYDALSEYMSARRSEVDSLQQLINLAPRFEKINLMLQSYLKQKTEPTEPPVTPLAVYQQKIEPERPPLQLPVCQNSGFLDTSSFSFDILGSMC